MLVLDLTDESRVDEPSLWLKDKALVHRGGALTSGRTVTDSGSCGRKENADSGLGGRKSLMGERVEAVLVGSGRDPTGRAGRLFRRLER
jgi:hypothetical protein